MEDAQNQKEVEIQIDVRPPHQKEPSLSGRPLMDHLRLDLTVARVTNPTTNAKGNSISIDAE